jgi:hypothetical protein
VRDDQDIVRAVSLEGEDGEVDGEEGAHVDDDMSVASPSSARSRGGGRDRDDDDEGDVNDGGRSCR